jgi:hypothetical protein
VLPIALLDLDLRQRENPTKTINEGKKKTIAAHLLVLLGTLAARPGSLLRPLFIVGHDADLLPFTPLLVPLSLQRLQLIVLRVREVVVILSLPCGTQSALLHENAS